MKAALFLAFLFLCVLGLRAFVHWWTRIPPARPGQFRPKNAQVDWKEDRE